MFGIADILTAPDLTAFGVAGLDPIFIPPISSAIATPAAIRAAAVRMLQTVRTRILLSPLGFDEL